MASVELYNEIAELIVTELNLDVPASSIDADAALYGDGLGLDSIDILEVVLVLSKRYGVQIKADGPNNHEVFGSLRKLAEHVGTHRTK